jgi:small subunit ribosomal protein S3
MGRKVNPIAIRIGINKTWDSVWYADKAQFPAIFAQDLKIEKKVRDTMKDSGVDRVKINRSANRIEIIANVARPGVAIGRGGEGIDKLQKDLKKMTKMETEVKIREVKKADLSARIIARTIAEGIERRQPGKLLMVSAKEKAMMAGAKGLRIWISGRINNASQARTIKINAGTVPAQTLKADVDFAEDTAKTLDAGLLGIKVWIYKGTKTDTTEEE